MIAPECQSREPGLSPPTFFFKLGQFRSPHITRSLLPGVYVRGITISLLSGVYVRVQYPFYLVSVSGGVQDPFYLVSMSEYKIPSTWCLCQRDYKIPSTWCLCRGVKDPFYLVSMLGGTRSLLPGVYVRGNTRSHRRGKCVICHGLSLT